MLTEEQQTLRSTIRRWTESEVRPHASDVDLKARFPSEAFESYVANGWVRMQYPDLYGGDGADSVSCGILIEEIARVCATTSLTAFISRLGTTPLIDWGSDEQKRHYLPLIASGEWQASYCLSESEAGSDAAAVSTTAERTSEGYVLNGIKCWITNAGVSRLYTVFAKTDADAGHRGLSCFLVERDWGVEFGSYESKMGVRGSPTGEVILRDVKVPIHSRVGAEGQGFEIAMSTLDRSRPIVGAQAVGIAQGALDYATAYVCQRKQFGRPVAEFQVIRFMLADMATKIEAARLLVYEALGLIDGKAPRETRSRTSAMAKCFASDTAMQITTDSVQLLGGYGYTTSHPVERFMRDAKVTQIYEGTNQIQRVVIANRLLSS